MVDISIVIPAYNEATVIEETLKPLQGQGFQIIVVPNGCTDNTTAVVRKVCPEAQIIDCPVGNKSMALNLGLLLAAGRTMVALDADIVTSAASIKRLDAALRQQGQADLAYGRACFQLQNSTAVVRQFYRAWQTNGYFARGKVGGCFALRRRALEAAGGFPPFTNDDEWVRRYFAARSVLVAGAEYAVRAPRRLSDLIAVRRRVTRGNRQLMAGMSQTGQKTKPGWQSLIRTCLADPYLWPGLFIYACVSVYVRLFPSSDAEWGRDNSNRQPPAFSKPAS